MPRRRDFISGQPALVTTFMVMLVTAAGNTGVQSIMPSIGRSLGLHDILIGLIFSFSALLWAFFASFWANRLERIGARKMMLAGMIGFIISQLICGVALTLGLANMIPPLLTLIIFIFARSIYGIMGAAAPPAAQAIVALRTAKSERTAAMTLLASAFGLGTVLGPALSPFFIIPGLGIAAPLYAFALIGIITFVMAARLLPESDAVADVEVGLPPEPNITGGAQTAVHMLNRQSEGRLAHFDPRIRAWVILGLCFGHAQAMLVGLIGFAVIDRLQLPLAEAQPIIGLVMMMGAGAALLAQWGVIPRLGPTPSQMMLWGALLAMLGSFGMMMADSMHAISVSFAIASLGFGFLRPGMMAGASLAVSSREQALVAGKVTSINGLVFVLGPSLGIILYEMDYHLPFFIIGVIMAINVWLTWHWLLRKSTPV